MSVKARGYYRDGIPGELLEAETSKLKFGTHVCMETCDPADPSFKFWVAGNILFESS